MSLVVNHNLMAANASKNLNTHYCNLATSTKRLSTGLRINSASDDAAGLAIREMMRADIAAVRQGVRNANDAISMLQTMDGALSIIDEKLVRMKELAEQAATGTYNSVQRLMIQSEFEQMGAEIDRIANATDFNGIRLLNYKERQITDDDISSNIANNVIFAQRSEYPATASDPELNINDKESLLGTTTITVVGGNSSIIGNGRGVVSTHLRSYSVTPTITLDIEWDGNVTYEDTNGSHTGQWKVITPGYRPNDNDNTLTPGEYLSGFQWISTVDPTNGNRIYFNIFNDGIINDGDRTTITVNFNSLDYMYTISGAGANTAPQTSGTIIPTRVSNDHFSFSFDLGNGNTVTQDFTFENAAMGAYTAPYSIPLFTETITVTKPTQDENNVKIHFGHDNSLDDYYYIDKTNATLEGLGLKDISIETQENAQKSLNTITDAIVKKDTIRAYYGAMQNRLENTISNTTIYGENLHASESRISDVDVATEMTNFVRNQILTQSAVAMLSQANSIPQMTMQLINV